MIAFTRLPVLATALLAGLFLAGQAPAGTSWNRQAITEKELHEKFGSEEDEIGLHEALRYLLLLVNEERKRNDLQPLAGDRIASYAAEEHAREMAENHYLSHLNLRGEKPNQRYNCHGGTAQVTENLSYWESDIRLYLTPQAVENIHQRWMDSPSHSRNILTPTHTSVGIAIVLEWDGESSVLTAAQEFVDDYGDFAPLPAEAYPAEELELRGEFADRDMTLAYIAVGYEPLPQRQRPENLNANLNGYSLPAPFAALMPTADRNQRRVTGLPNLYLLAYDDFRARFSAKFSVNDLFEELERMGRVKRFVAGLYYFTVWVQPPEGEPFIVSTQVVRVEG